MAEIMVRIKVHSVDNEVWTIIDVSFRYVVCHGHEYLGMGLELDDLPVTALSIWPV